KLILILSSLLISLLVLGPALAGNLSETSALQKWDRFNGDFNHQWQARWDQDSGLINKVYGHRSPPLNLNAVTAARTFLSQLGTVVLGDQVSQDLELQRELVSPAGKHITFSQHVQGIPVYGAEVSVHLTHSHQAQLVTSSIVPGVSLPATKPALSTDEAIDYALNAVSAKSELRAEAAYKLVAYKNQGFFNLAWVVDVPLWKPLGDWRVIIDALDGSTLKIENRLNYVTGTGYVYDPNPVVAPGRVQRSLPNLDGTGYLQSSNIKVTNSLGGSRAYASNNIFDYAATNTHFEEVMAYYHINTMRSFIRGMGFSVMNYQLDADAHGTTDDNSWFSPSTQSITFGDGGVADAEDADIICHEYGHAVVNDIKPGLVYSGESGAINEGTADYFACTLAGDPNVGEWDSTAYSSAGYLRTADNSLHYPEDLQGQVHADGQIWSGTMWDIYETVGKTVADKIITQCLYYLTNNSSFEDGAQAILTADDNIYGGSHRTTLEGVFSARGILSQSYTPTGTVYTTSDTGVSIPDNNPTGATSQIFIGNSTTISELNVYLDISHTYIGDLEITLTSPSTTTVLIHNRTGSSQDDINAWYDPEAQPAQSLSAFNGTNTYGWWTLKVVDHAGADVGTINTWKIEIN
ncbi:proprotein convertase P-domain-containing protein, partial [candidate division CSSED10-310 bacterium]